MLRPSGLEQEWGRSTASTARRKSSKASGTQPVPGWSRYQTKMRRSTCCTLEAGCVSDPCNGHVQIQAS